MGFRQERGTSGLRKYWPVLGFLMFVALAIVSYAAAPAMITWARGAVPGFRGNELSPDLMRLAFAGLLFVVLGSLAAAVLAFAAPKRRLDDIKDSSLMKEREAILREREAARRRQRQINRANRQK